jgi:hypothetical protein
LCSSIDELNCTIFLEMTPFFSGTSCCRSEMSPDLQERLIQAVEAFPLNRARAGTVNTPRRLIGRKWQGQVIQALGRRMKSESLVSDRLEIGNA